MSPVTNGRWWKRLFCAHLTYPSLGRLHLKAAIGRNKMRNGFPRDHGWQNQMLARIADAGGLDAFWRRHSVGPWGPPTLATGATIVEDGTFAASLVKTLALLDEALRAPPRSPERRQRRDVVAGHPPRIPAEGARGRPSAASNRPREGGGTGAFAAGSRGAPGDGRRYAGRRTCVGGPVDE